MNIQGADSGRNLVPEAIGKEDIGDTRALEFEALEVDREAGALKATIAGHGYSASRAR